MNQVESKNYKELSQLEVGNNQVKGLQIFNKLPVNVKSSHSFTNFKHYVILQFLNIYGFSHNKAPVNTHTSH